MSQKPGILYQVYQHLLQDLAPKRVANADSHSHPGCFVKNANLHHGP